MKLSKTLSLLTAATITLGGLFSLTSCSNSPKNSAQKVASDSEWFDFESHDIDLSSYGYKYFMLNTAPIPVADGYIARFSKDFYDQYGHLIYFDKDLNVTDASQLMAEDLNFDSTFYCFLNDMMVVDGEPIVNATLHKFHEDTFESEDYTVIYNLTKNAEVNYDYLTSKTSTNTSQEFGMTPNGYDYIFENGSYEKDFNPVIHLGKDGEFLKSIPLNYEDFEFFTLNEVEADGDTLMFDFPFTYDPDTFEATYIRANINTKNYKVDYTFFNRFDYVSGIFFIPNQMDTKAYKYYEDDDNYYYCSEDGIYHNDELEVPFSASYCDMSKINNSVVIDVTDDSYTLINNYFDSTYDLNSNCYTISKFTKADSNPNAGKTILSIGYVNGLDPIISSAIAAYNSTNEDYYIESTMYKTESEDGSDLNEASAILSNELMLDMINGDGPDLLVNAASFSQFNNDKFLIDLSSFADDVLSEEDVFDNVLTASKTKDKLYQIPLSFMFEGFISKTEEAGNITGLNIEEFDNFVNTTCNGVNPLTQMNTKIDAFNQCLASYSDMMYDNDGYFSADNEAFRELAEYFFNSVPENEEETPENIFASHSSRPWNAGVVLDSIDTYAWFDADLVPTTVIGFPSPDRRGPAITAISSIAISSNASNEKAAKDFIKFIFSNSDFFNRTDCNSILISATRDNSEKIIDFYIDQYKKEGKASGLHEYDKSIINSYIELVKTADCTSSIDPNIAMIIYEEMPAYFVGQKSLDDVITIINDRAKTVIDER